MWATKEIPDQKGRTAIVTGANTGIGYEIALALYIAGANVIVACRDKDKAKQAIVKIESENGAGSLKVGILDLSNLASVREFAELFITNHQQLHLLINNAGVAIPPASKTNEGFELQFGINFLGHFALTGLLYPLLEATAGSRIVTMSSNGYRNAVIDFDNLKSEKDYNPFREYGQSKLADLVFSIELDRRVKAKGHQVVSIATQPGANNTELTRHFSDKEMAMTKERIGAFMEPWQGALSPLYAATSSEATGGNMYEPEDGGNRGYPALATLQGNALNETVAKKLWKIAQRATGIVYPV